MTTICLNNCGRNPRNSHLASEPRKNIFFQFIFIQMGDSSDSDSSNNDNNNNNENNNNKFRDKIIIISFISFQNYIRCLLHFYIMVLMFCKQKK